MSVAILTNNAEVDNNMRNESRGTGFYKRKQGANHVSKKIVYDKIFMIVSCEYKIMGVSFSSSVYFFIKCGLVLSPQGYFLECLYA